MKKPKINLILSYLSSVVLLFSLTSCSEEIINNNEETNQSKIEKVSYLNKNEIPSEIKFINKYTNLKVRKSKKTNLSEIYPYLETENIMMFRDSLIKNYSFKLINLPYQERVFYNLILKTKENTMQNPYIIKYTMERKFFSSYSRGDVDFQNFKGSLQKIKIVDFLANLTKDNDPCPPYETDNGSGNGGSGGTNDGTGIDTGAGIGSGSGTGSGSNSGGGSSHWEIRCFISPRTFQCEWYLVRVYTKNNKDFGEDPCNPIGGVDDGGVGVNLINLDSFVQLTNDLNEVLCNDLTGPQQNLTFNKQHIASLVLTFLETNVTDCSSLNFDMLMEIFEQSANSPFNLDTSGLVDNISPLPNDGTPEAIKLKCIYNKLTQSPLFKQLFVDTFGQSENVNVKFEIVDFNAVNGVTADGATDANVLDVRMQTIKLDRGKLLSNHPLIVAQTIIHEALHAFINVKQVYCHNNGIIATGTNQTYITNLNQLTFDELLNDFYIDCAVNQPNQHRLMYNQMVNAMDEMLEDVFNDLVAPEDLSANFEINSNYNFNWTDAIHHLNLGGLQEAEEYIADAIGYPNQTPPIPPNNPDLSFLVFYYDFKVNCNNCTTNILNHNTCN